MRRSSWKSFGLALLMSWMSVAGSVVWANEPASHLPVAEASQGKERLVTVDELLVDESYDCLELVTEGRTPEGERVEKRHRLSKNYEVSEEHYAEAVVDEEDGYRERYYHIVYHYRGRTFVAGVHTRFSRGGPESWFEPRDWDLTNVPWGFDVSKQRFRIEANPEQMPPMPVPFKGRNWKGLRFGIAGPLERYLVREAKLLIELRGGQVIENPKETVDVVLVADDVDFAWDRNQKAEAWMRRGAKVLWEKEFPRPGHGD